MAEIGYASLGIIPSFDGFQGRLERGAVGPMGAAGAAGGERFGRSFSARAKNAVKIGMAGVAVAAAGAIKFAGDSIEEARDAQKVGAQTRAVIKSTGGAAKVTERSMGRLAERLSDMAGIDDELIQSGGNVLLTFTKIRNEAGKGNQVFDRATEAALNMSVALDQDLRSASIQVGKALNDPVKGVTALGRAGVQFSEDQKAAIKTMVEQGDVLGAQKTILKELDTQFKGSAKAQATEADKLSVAWGNLKEDVGNELLPVMDDLAVWIRTEGIPLAKRFGRFVRDDVVPAFQDFAREAEPAVQMAKDLAGFLNDLPKSVKIGGLGAIAALIGGAKLRGGGGGALGTAGRVLGATKPVPVFVTNPGVLGGDAAGGGSTRNSALKNVAKYGGPAALLGGAALGLKELYDFNRGDDKGLAFLGGGRLNDMIGKTRENLHGLSADVDKLDRKATNLGPYRMGMEIPALNPLFSRVTQFGSLLDGLDGRVVTTFIRTVTDQQAGRLSSPNRSGIDSGETVSRRTGGVTIQHMEVKDSDPQRWKRELEHMDRTAAVGGADFR